MKLSPTSSFHAHSGDLFLNENDSQKQIDDLESLNIDESSASIKSYVDIEVQNKIETLYAEIVYEAKNEPVLTLYQQNFEFIYHLVKALIENETKLKNLIIKLKSNIEELTNKFNKSIELSSTDHQTIVKLRNEIENAWKIAHIANQKEKRTRETVSAMKLEISNLSKLVEQGVGLTMGQEYNIHQIVKQNETLNDENIKIKEDIENLTKQLNEFKNQENKLEIFKNETN
jgi:chromosome segregation ATPase